MSDNDSEMDMGGKNPPMARDEEMDLVCEKCGTLGTSAQRANECPLCGERMKKRAKGEG